MRRYTGIFLSPSGAPVAGASLTVVGAGTQAAVTLYEESGPGGASVPLANPVTTDVEGQFTFIVPSGTYDLLDNGGGVVLREVQIYDHKTPGEWLPNVPLAHTLVADDVAKPALRLIGSDVSSAAPNANLFEVFHRVDDLAPIFALDQDSFLLTAAGYLRLGLGNPLTPGGARAAIEVLSQSTDLPNKFLQVYDGADQVRFELDSDYALTFYDAAGLVLYSLDPTTGGVTVDGNVVHRILGYTDIGVLQTSLMVVYSNEGAAKVLRQVKVGATGTGPGGTGRALYVS